MNRMVVIKKNPYGVTIIIDPSVEYSFVQKEIAEKFSESAQFFSGANMAVAFEGKPLTQEQQLELIDLIQINGKVNVICIMDEDSEKSKVFQTAMEHKLMELSGRTGQFYKGCIRSGQVLETETSVIVIGDVNPGARIVSKGNIIVIGSLKGTAYAGAGGNKNSFVMALNMQPSQIQIADTIARAPDTPGKAEQEEPKIAYCEDENICIDAISKSVLNDIQL